MKKIIFTSIALPLLFTAQLATAHPACPQKEFWGQQPNCEEHVHEEATKEITLVGAEEKHIVYFDFDSAIVGNIGDITNYVDQLKNLDGINLVGHADRLGESDYNVALSKRRVEAVAKALQKSGIAADKIISDYKGENIPAKSCEGERSPELIECLFANRRVEIEITGEKVLNGE